MNDIDLFPEDLRRKLLFQRWFKWAGAGLVLVTVACIAAFFTLREVNTRIDAEITRFQTQREITTANRQQLERLNQQKQDLRQQLDLLSGLRSGASAEQMFLMIDRALPGPDVWLTNWKFRRAGTPVENREEAVNTGYFIVIQSDSPQREEEAWKIETTMTIQGQALDHVAMSKFVLNLTQQPEIEKVRIVNTRLNESGAAKLVDFGLDIVVSARSRRS